MRHVVIVTGSRNWTDRAAVWRRLSRYPAGTIVLHGAARGADALADDVCKACGHQVVGHPFFDGYGKAGGVRRNALLVSLAVAYAKSEAYTVTVEAFPLPGGIGTQDCMRRAEKAGLAVRDKEEEWVLPRAFIKT